MQACASGPSSTTKSCTSNLNIHNHNNNLVSDKMPRKSDPARPPGPHTAQDASAPRPVRTQPVAQRIFLTFYNLISAVLWAVVLERTVLVYLYQGPWKVYFVVGQWLTVTQTLAVSEVLFSLVGE